MLPIGSIWHRLQPSIDIRLSNVDGSGRGWEAELETEPHLNSIKMEHLILCQVQRIQKVPTGCQIKGSERSKKKKKNRTRCDSQQLLECVRASVCVCVGVGVYATHAI